ncbi:MAG: hypothetical protein GF350_09380, partial [Chitinivibrionales bacterium]|nr:hypothetical protein [Chitinivibrionales bacterium]
MKPRKWVLVFFLSFCALVFGLYQGVKYLEKQGNIERILVEHISPLIGGTFDVEKVRFGFLSAYLVNVRVTIPVYALKLTVNDIKVSFSLFDLVRSRGDFAESIDKIILLGPQVAVDLFAGKPESAGERVPPETIQSFSLPENLPVEYLYIKRGTVQFVGRSGEQIDFGEGLAGKLWEDRDGLYFDCAGKIASRRRNLSFSGMFSRTGERHRLSLRLDNARIGKPLDLKSLVITDGVLDGVCEFFFSDTLRAGLVDARGNFRVDNGVCRLDGSAEEFTGIALRLNLDGSVVHVDSALCVWRHASVNCTGKWDMANSEESRLAVSVNKITMENIRPELPVFLKKIIPGNAWVTLNVIRKSGETFPRLHLSCGGLSLMGIPLTESGGEVDIRKQEAVIKHFFIRGDGIELQSQGTIGYPEAPVD